MPDKPADKAADKPAADKAADKPEAASRAVPTTDTPKSPKPDTFGGVPEPEVKPALVEDAPDPPPVVPQPPIVADALEAAPVEAVEEDDDEADAPKTNTQK